jgi:hypothetical protein
MSASAQGEAHDRLPALADAKLAGDRTVTPSEKIPRENG